MTLRERDAFKAAAAEAAVALVQPGTTLGLGTGSTVSFALRALSRRIHREGLVIRGVPTSRATEVQARTLGIPLTTLDEAEHVDLALDGADEVDLGFAMIKGGGGALLHEKIVARAAARLVVMVDDAKLVQVLGDAALPLEIVPFGRRPLLRALSELGVEAHLREQHGQPFVTDSGHWIVDCAFGEIFDPSGLHARLLDLPAVVETGLFVDTVHTLVVAGPDGVRKIEARPQD